MINLDHTSTALSIGLLYETLIQRSFMANPKPMFQDFTSTEMTKLVLCENKVYALERSENHTKLLAKAKRNLLVAFCQFENLKLTKNDSEILKSGLDMVDQATGSDGLLSAMDIILNLSYRCLFDKNGAL